MASTVPTLTLFPRYWDLFLLQMAISWGFGAMNVTVTCCPVLFLVRPQMVNLHYSHKHRGTHLNFAQLKDSFTSYLHTLLSLFLFPFIILCSSGLRVVSCSTIFPHFPQLSTIARCFVILLLSRFLFSPLHSITSLGFPWPSFTFHHVLSHSFTFA